MLPLQTPEAERAAYRHAHGLDQPIPVQYLNYLGGLLEGDFGRSFVYGRPALAVVLDHLPPTVELALAAMLIGVVVAIPAGVLAAVKRNSLIDRAVCLVATLGVSLPAFWLGMLLILVFAVGLRLLPVSGTGGVEHLVLPALTLATWPLTLTTRLTRSEILEVLSQDYIRTARSKGLRGFAVVGRHALRNALLPIVTVLGMNLGGMLGGAVAVETVFSWPGVGMLMMSSILARDYPVVLTALIAIAAGFIAINFCVDVLYGFLDPRLRMTDGR